MNPIGSIVFAALIFEAGLRILSEALNLRSAAAGVPEAFRDVYDPQRYGRSQAYIRARTRFGWVCSAFFLALTLGFWLGGGFRALDGWVRGLGLGPVLSGLAFIGALLLGRGALAVPFQAYAVFGIEQRFGFNRTRLRTFVADGLKALALSALLGAPLLAGVLALFEHAGPLAWVYVWALAAAYTAGVQFLAPRLIFPLFNKFTPLPEGELRTAILEYARSIRFPLENILVMDGSRRSAKGNAFFTGFGRHRRIALFDTLIAGHTVPELVAVLAHETGHYRQKHVLKKLALGLAHTGALLFAFSLAVRLPALFEAFFVERPSVYAGLVFFALALRPVELALGILSQRISRAHESEADRFAAETTGDGGALIAALKKLSADNLSNLTPHPLYVALTYSHPPIQERIRAIADLPAAAGPGMPQGSPRGAGAVSIDKDPAGR
jgi:STE24 endopeptidase